MEAATRSVEKARNKTNCGCQTEAQGNAEVEIPARPPAWSSLSAAASWQSPAWHQLAGRNRCSKHQFSQGCWAGRGKRPGLPKGHWQSSTWQVCVPAAAGSVGWGSTFMDRCELGLTVSPTVRGRHGSHVGRLQLGCIPPGQPGLRQSCFED